MELVLKMAQARLSPPTFGQLGATAVYQLGHDYYRPMIAEYQRRRNILKDSLDQMDGVFCPQIDGAFYAMVKLPVDDTDRFCQWMLESFEHEGATVMMAPGSGFYASSTMGHDQVRIAYVLNSTDLQSAMNCLAAGLEAYQGAAV